MVLPGVMTRQNDVTASGETPSASCAFGLVKKVNLGLTVTTLALTFHDLLAHPPNAPQARHHR